MSDTVTTKSPPPVDRPPETSNGRPKRSPSEDGRTRMQQVGKTAALAVGSSMQAAANAAAQISIWVYLAWILRVFGFTGLFVVYQNFEAEGMRELFGEVVSKRLSRACPFLLAWMENFRETRSLDMANALAAALLVFTYLSFEAIIYRIVHRETGESLAERYLVLVPATVLLVMDTVLFAAGVYASGSFSSLIPAVMLALAYDAMLVLFSFWVIKIERRKSI